MGQTDLILVFWGFMIFIWFLYMTFLFAKFSWFLLNVYTHMCLYLQWSTFRILGLISLISGFDCRYVKWPYFPYGKGHDHDRQTGWRICSTTSKASGLFVCHDETGSLPVICSKAHAKTNAIFTDVIFS